MNIRRFRIAVASGVVLLLVGIGVYVAYDMNTPIQAVKVYKLPDKGPRVALAKQMTPEGTETFAPPEDYDNATSLLSEACCPDELSEPVALDDEIVHDSNPVSPAVIEDGKRAKEWLEALALHQGKSNVHIDEGEVLLQGLISTVQDLCATMPPEVRAELFSTIESQIPDMSPKSREMISDMIYGKEYSSLTEEQILSDWETSIFSMEEWSKRGETLFQESPTPPTLTHTH